MKPHILFTRDGQDLHFHLDIGLLEALEGFQKDIIHLDQHRVPVTKTTPTAHGDVIKVDGEGMAGESFRGDLYVHMRVNYPSGKYQLSEAEKQKLRAVFSTPQPHS